MPLAGPALHFTHWPVGQLPAEALHDSQALMGMVAPVGPLVAALLRQRVMQGEARCLVMAEAGLQAMSPPDQADQ